MRDAHQRNYSFDVSQQSFSEAASGFNLLGSRPQGNRAHTSTPGKMREGARQVGDQLASSITHRTGRSLYRNPPDHHSARRKSLLRQLAPTDKTRSKFHSRSDSPPISRPSPITANLFSPLTIKRSSLQKPEAVSSAPFRKGLTDEEQAGLPGISTSSHTQSVYVSSPNTSKLSAEIKQPRLDRHFSSSSHEANHDSSQNCERHKQRLPSTSRNASGSYVEGQPKPCLASELPFSKAASVRQLGFLRQGLIVEFLLFFIRQALCLKPSRVLGWRSLSRIFQLFHVNMFDS
jgi:hypothetical protein